MTQTLQKASRPQLPAERLVEWCWVTEWCEHDAALVPYLLNAHRFRVQLWVSCTALCESGVNAPKRRASFRSSWLLRKLRLLNTQAGTRLRRLGRSGPRVALPSFASAGTRCAGRRSLVAGKQSR